MDLKQQRWRRVVIVMLTTVISIGWTPFAFAMHQDGTQIESSRTESLMEHVGPPSHEAIDIFRYAGMGNIKPHILTRAERTRLKLELSLLPSLHRRVLEKKLHRLAFVDGIPGEGTGLTSPFLKTGLYDITLRTSILYESLSTFLTTKERRVFRNDGSGITVSVDGTGTDALTYVLLHESTHVVDLGCGITAKSGNGFDRGIWSGRGTLTPKLAFSVAAKTIFRGGSLIESKRAGSVYDALAETPFVSLYATAAASEDFAELVAWREIQVEHHGRLEISVKDAGGNTLARWQPLAFPQVRNRLSTVDKFLASSGTVCANG